MMRVAGAEEVWLLDVRDESRLLMDGREEREKEGREKKRKKKKS